MKFLAKLGCIFAALVLVLSAHSANAQGALRNGDTLDIRLSGVPSEEIGNFSAPYTIDESGTINLPYIGTLKVVGILANQAQILIEEKLKSEKIFTHPTVTISIAAGNRFVSVGGAVRSPGRVPYTADLTLMSAINAAGGFNDFADKKRVHLVREGKTQKIDTRELVKDPSKDLKVQPSDQIDVPQSLW